MLSLTGETGPPVNFCPPQTHHQLASPRLVMEQESRLASLEEELHRLREQSVDQQSLLNTISQDKETISR